MSRLSGYKPSSKGLANASTQSEAGSEHVELGSEMRLMLRKIPVNSKEFC